jgi:transcriptional regulator with XRE-family HTH domain
MLPPHTPVAAVAAAVRAELARAGISGRKLARDLGWTHGWIARRLAVEDPHPFRVDELARIAEHLDVPMTRFVETADKAAS